MPRLQILYILFLTFLYSCSPINKQHGYLLDDVLVSSDEISRFEINKTKSEIYEVMGSPSIEIRDIDDIWIYLISLKEKNVFEDDELTYRLYFVSLLMSMEHLLKKVLDHNDYKKISFHKRQQKCVEMRMVLQISFMKPLRVDNKLQRSNNRSATILVILSWLQRVQQCLYMGHQQYLLSRQLYELLTLFHRNYHPQQTFLHYPKHRRQLS